MAGCAKGGAIDLDPRPDSGTMPGDAGRFQACAVLNAIENESCTSIGAICRSSLCAVSPCDPGCVELACADGLWTRRSSIACEDTGTMGDGGLPTGCSMLTADRTSAIYETIGSVYLGSMIWDGQRFVIVGGVGTTNPPVYSLFFAVVDRDGNVVPSSVHRILEEETHLFEGGVIALGDGEYGLAYLRSADTTTRDMRPYFVRLDRDGFPIGESVQMSDGDVWGGLGLAWSPVARRWAFAWEHAHPLADGHSHSYVHLKILDDQGRVVTATPTRLDTLLSSRFDRGLVWTGDRFAAAFGEYSDWQAREVLVEIDPASPTVSRRTIVGMTDGPRSVVLATDGTMYGVAWIAVDNTLPLDQQAYFARAMVGGDVIGAADPISDFTQPVSFVSLVFDGDTFRLVSEEDDTSAHRFYVARIARDGTHISTAPVLDGTAPYGGYPYLISDGCNDALATIGTTYNAIMDEYTSALRLTMLAGVSN